MATILQANQGAQQDDENKDKAVQASSAQTTQIGANQGQPSAGQVKAQGPSSSGRFANIQSFLKANQSGQIGQQVGQQVGAEKQKATQKLQESKDAFGGQIGQVRAGVEASNKAVNEGIAQLNQAQDFTVDDSGADLVAANIKKAQDLRYEGPQSLGSEEQLYGQAQNLAQIGQASKSEGGRAALLQRFFGRDRPTYSAGQNKLDNLLLGRQSSALADVRRTGKDFTRDVTAAEQQALKDIGSQQEAIKTNKAAAESQLADFLSRSEANLGQDLEAIASADTAARRAAPSIYAGFSAGGDYSKYLRGGNTDAYDSTSNVYSRLSAPELEAIGALNFNSELQGKNITDAATRAALLGRANTAQAGTFNKLAGLIGKEALASGEQLSAGKYSDLDAGAFDSFKQQIQADAKSLLDSGAFNKADYTKDFSMAGSPISGKSFDTERLKADAYSKALANYFASRGIKSNATAQKQAAGSAGKAQIARANTLKAPGKAYIR